MAKTATLLRILEEKLPRIQDRMVARLRAMGQEQYRDMDDEELRQLAWSYLDPVFQAIRYDNDHLYTFFIDFTSERNASRGEPIEDMQAILDLMGNLLWDVVSRAEPAEDRAANLARLISLLSQGKNAIAGIYMRQRNQVLEELRKANLRMIEEGKQRVDLLARVSHELKTPLTSVIAYSEQLREADMPEDIRQEFIQVIYTQSLKLQQLIEDLLAFSRDEDRQTRLDLAPADVHEVIDEALATVRASADEKNIKLVVNHLCGRLPEIRMDAFRIQQVLWNLLGNAIKYNRQGGEVEICARQRGDEVVISVRDTGIGISPEDQEKIFRRFHRSDNPMALAENGTGLGLDLTRQYVNLHGGDVWVESRPGEGSTFFISLPLEGPPELPAEEKVLQVSKTLKELPTLRY